MSKIDDSIQLIRTLANAARSPVAMLSFGKDSMVMASLIREAFPLGLNGTHFPRPNAFPLPVIYHRDPWFPAKNDFADQVIHSWAIDAFDYPPYASGVKTNDTQIELVSRYSFGNDGIDIPKNVEIQHPRRNYICGLNDWVMRPKIRLLFYPWDLVFIGHKSSDVDPFEGKVPLLCDHYQTAGVTIGFPLRHWTDNEIWDYIEENHIAYQKTRYKDRKEMTDTWYNPDWTHACTRCIDPREEAPEIFCPKLKRNVPNRGKEVVQLRNIPEYVG